MAKLVWKGDNYRYRCGICSNTWWTQTRTSQCRSCGIVFLPSFDSLKPSQIAKSRQDSPEQLGFGRMP